MNLANVNHVQLMNADHLIHHLDVKGQEIHVLVIKLISKTLVIDSPTEIQGMAQMVIMTAILKMMLPEETYLLVEILLVVLMVLVVEEALLMVMMMMILSLSQMVSLCAEMFPSLTDFFLKSMILINNFSVSSGLQIFLQQILSQC